MTSLYQPITLINEFHYMSKGLSKFLQVLEFDLKMACAKFQRNRFRIVEDIDVIKHALQIYLNNCGPWQAYR